jgi:hypothetical protein
MDWPYRSHRELSDAGYFHRDLTHCPLCGAPIEIYQRGGEFPVFVDRQTWALHIAQFLHAAPRPAQPLDGKSAAGGEKP